MKRRDNMNRTALHYAFGVGERKVVDLLLKNGAETKVNFTNILKIGFSTKLV